MTKVTKAQVAIYTEAKDRVQIDMVRGNRLYWSIYGIRYERVKIGNEYKTFSSYAWNRATKAEVTEELADYGLTLEAFVAIDSGEYEVIDEVAEENAVEEIDAQEVAIQAEVENAENAKENAETPKYRVESVVYVDVYPYHYNYSVGYTSKRNVPMERSADYFFMAHYGVVINQETGEIEYDFGCKNVLDGYFKSLPYTAENAVEEIDASELCSASENEQADDVEVIGEEIKSWIDDELFVQADFINKDAKNIVECAEAVEGGDICIEGKAVGIYPGRGASGNQQI